MFEIGQTFEGRYPPEAAAWCNNHNAYIVKRGTTYVIEEVPAPTPEEIQARLTQAVQDRLDSEAQALGYDSCLSVCSYADTGVAKFDAEGAAFRSWRSAVWQSCYAILDAVKAGQRPIPTEGELLAELPALEIVYE